MSFDSVYFGDFHDMLQKGFRTFLAISKPILRTVWCVKKMTVHVQRQRMFVTVSTRLRKQKEQEATKVNHFLEAFEWRCIPEREPTKPN